MSCNCYHYSHHNPLYDSCKECGKKYKDAKEQKIKYQIDKSNIWPDTDEYTRKCYDKCTRPGFAGKWSSFWGGVPGLP